MESSLAQPVRFDYFVDVASRAKRPPEWDRVFFARMEPNGYARLIPSQKTR